MNEDVRAAVELLKKKGQTVIDMSAAQAPAIYVATSTDVIDMKYIVDFADTICYSLRGAVASLLSYVAQANAISYETCCDSDARGEYIAPEECSNIAYFARLLHETSDIVMIFDRLERNKKQED